MEWLILGLLVVLLAVIVVIARAITRLSRGLRELQHGLGSQREIVENRILKSMDSLQHRWLQATSRQPLHRRHGEIHAALENLKNAEGLKTLEHIERIVELARVSMRPKALADKLLERLRNEKLSPAVRIYLVDAIRRIEQEDKDEWNTMDMLAEAVIKGLRDDEPSIRAFCASLAGHHGLQRDEIEDRLQKLGEDEDEAFSVRRCSAWALSRFFGQTFKPLDTKQRGQYGYVLVKSLESTTNNVEKLIADRPWSEANKAGVLEGSLIQGTYDVFLKVAAEDQHYLGDFVMNDIQGLPWVESTLTLPIISMPRQLYWVRWDNFQYEALSWVQVNAPFSASALVVLAAREVLIESTQQPAILEAGTVYGPAEVMLKFVGKSQEELDEIIKGLHEIPYVTATVTYRVLEPVRRNHFSWLADDREMGDQVHRLFEEYLIDNDNKMI